MVPIGAAELIGWRGAADDPNGTFRFANMGSVAGGFGCYAIATILYLHSLGRLDLSVAYPTVSLGYVLVTLMSKKLFDEPVTSTRWMAVVMICSGVGIVGFG